MTNLSHVIANIRVAPGLLNCLDRNSIVQLSNVCRASTQFSILLDTKCTIPFVNNPELIPTKCVTDLTANICVYVPESHPLHPKNVAKLIEQTNPLRLNIVFVSFTDLLKDEHRYGFSETDLRNYIENEYVVCKNATLECRHEFMFHDSNYDRKNIPLYKCLYHIELIDHEYDNSFITLNHVKRDTVKNNNGYTFSHENTNGSCVTEEKQENHLHADINKSTSNNNDTMFRNIRQFGKTTASLNRESAATYNKSIFVYLERIKKEKKSIDENKEIINGDKLPQYCIYCQHAYSNRILCNLLKTAPKSIRNFNLQNQTSKFNRHSSDLAIDSSLLNDYIVAPFILSSDRCMRAIFKNRNSITSLSFIDLIINSVSSLIRQPTHHTLFDSRVAHRIRIFEFIDCYIYKLNSNNKMKMDTINIVEKKIVVTPLLHYDMATATTGQNFGLSETIVSHAILIILTNNYIGYNVDEPKNMDILRDQIVASHLTLYVNMLNSMSTINLLNVISSMYYFAHVNFMIMNNEENMFVESYDSNNSICGIRSPQKMFHVIDKKLIGLVKRLQLPICSDTISNIRKNSNNMFEFNLSDLITFRQNLTSIKLIGTASDVNNRTFTYKIVSNAWRIVYDRQQFPSLKYYELNNIITDSMTIPDKLFSVAHQENKFDDGGQKENNSGQKENNSGQKENNSGQKENNSGQKENNGDQKENNGGQKENNGDQLFSNTVKLLNNLVLTRIIVLDLTQEYPFVCPCTENPTQYNRYLCSSKMENCVRCNGTQNVKMIKVMPNILPEWISRIINTISFNPVVPILSTNTIFDRSVINHSTHAPLDHDHKSENVKYANVILNITFSAKCNMYTILSNMFKSNLNFKKMCMVNLNGLSWSVTDIKSCGLNKIVSVPNMPNWRDVQFVFKDMILQIKNMAGRTSAGNDHYTSYLINSLENIRYNTSTLDTIFNVNELLRIVIMVDMSKEQSIMFSPELVSNSNSVHSLIILCSSEPECQLNIIEKTNTIIDLIVKYKPTHLDLVVNECRENKPMRFSIHNTGFVPKNVKIHPSYKIKIIESIICSLYEFYKSLKNSKYIISPYVSIIY